MMCIIIKSLHYFSLSSLFLLMAVLLRFITQKCIKEYDSLVSKGSLARNK